MENGHGNVSCLLHWPVYVKLYRFFEWSEKRGKFGGTCDSGGERERDIKSSRGAIERYP